MSEMFKYQLIENGSSLCILTHRLLSTLKLQLFDLPGWFLI